MSNFLIFKAAFNNSATPAIGTYTAEGATASFTQDASLSPDYYLYNTAAGSTAVQWFVPTKETTDFEFVADILTDDQSLDGDRYFIIADSTGTTGLCMLSSSSITEWRFMNGDGTATSDPEYVGAIDPATSGGFDKFHQFRVRVRKLTASSSSVEVYVGGTLKLTATAGAALVTCAKIGFIGGVTGSPSTDSGIKNAYVYDLSGGELVDRGVLSEGFNRLIDWNKGIFVPRSGTNALAGSIVPDTNDAYDFGSSNYFFKNTYSKTMHAETLVSLDNMCGIAFGASDSIKQFRPRAADNNAILLGMALARWKEIWCTQSSINSSSDERQKQQIKPIDDDLLDAWENVNPIEFKWNDAVAEKGNNARVHTGYIAQNIQQALTENGVNPNDYGLFLYDEWGEEQEEKDEQGNIIKPYRPSGNAYGLRYTEALIVECAYLRKKVKELTARIGELEKGNNSK